MAEHTIYKWVKRILKILLITVGSLLLLFILTTWIIYKYKNEWLQKQIQLYMNESQSGQLVINSLDIRLLRNFPHMTLELKGISYYEHRDSVRPADEKPIFQADNFFVAIEIVPLFANHIKTTLLHLDDGLINLSRDRAGVLNISRALQKPVKPGSPVAVSRDTTKKIVKSTTPVKKPATQPKPAQEEKAELQIDFSRILITNIEVVYSPGDTANNSHLIIDQLEANLLKGSKTIVTNVSCVSRAEKIIVKNISLPEAELKMNASLEYDIATKRLSITNSEISSEYFSGKATGYYINLRKPTLDFHIDVSADDLDILSFVVKPELMKQNPSLLKHGSLYFNGRLFGDAGRPEMKFNFGMRDLTLKIPKSTGEFSGVGFDGMFESGKKQDLSEAKLEIKNLRGKLPGGHLRGNISCTNFANPYISYDLNAKLKVDGYDEVFQMDFLKYPSGTISLEAKYNGPARQLATHKMDERRSSMIKLDSLAFTPAKSNKTLTLLSGIVETKNNRTTIKGIKINYGENDLQLDCSIDNLVYYLFFKEDDFKISGRISSRQFFTKDIIIDSTKHAEINDRLSNVSCEFTLQSAGDDSAILNKKYFEIKNLTASLDKLANIRMLNANGWLGKTEKGKKLVVQKFRAVMPEGEINFSGGMLITGIRKLQIDAKIQLKTFPWTYIKDLSAEMSLSREPAFKNTPLSKMEIVSADADLSAELITYPFDINNLQIRNSKAKYNFSEKQFIEAEKVNGSFDKIHFEHPNNSGSITGIVSVNGKISMENLKIPGINQFSTDMNVSGKDNKVNVSFSRFGNDSKSENGNMAIDMTKKETAYRLTFAAKKSNLEPFLKRYYHKRLMSGYIDYACDLSTSGSEWPEIKKKISGSIEISADSVFVHGVDIDNILKKYEKSQNFNLTDLGAVLVAGPVGLAITKGTDFISLASVELDSTQQTNIRKLFSKWNIGNQVLSTVDVAITTAVNRIAIKGSIDLANDTVPGLTIGVVDKKGCSLMDQKLYGKFGAMQTGKLNIAKTIFGPVINSVDAVDGHECVPFYTGRVKNPVE